MKTLPRIGTCKNSYFKRTTESYFYNPILISPILPILLHAMVVEKIPDSFIFFLFPQRRVTHFLSVTRTKWMKKSVRKLPFHGLRNFEALVGSEVSVFIFHGTTRYLFDTIQWKEARVRSRFWSFLPWYELPNPTDWPYGELYDWFTTIALHDPGLCTPLETSKNLDLLLLPLYNLLVSYESLLAPYHLFTPLSAPPYFYLTAYNLAL